MNYLVALIAFLISQDCPLGWLGNILMLHYFLQFFAHCMLLGELAGRREGAFLILGLVCAVCTLLKESLRQDYNMTGCKKRYNKCILVAYFLPVVVHWGRVSYVYLTPPRVKVV